ncbi:hypothetical protein HMI55_004305 [Coelomomyces lativittatus]|nr:hypothetical protein HMI56_002076 [Coelomomyces lativittatus]KAJ1514833.1 hypothetical protein HMI55_004305 [Coelomomyces lativittatus]
MQELSYLDLLHPIFLSLLGEPCTTEWLTFLSTGSLSLHLPSATCLSLSLSKILGIGIVVGSALIKVPQIWKVIHHRSGEGLNGWSISLETFSLMLYGYYNVQQHHAWTTYGETFALALQNILLLGCLVYFGTFSGLGTLVTLMMVGTLPCLPSSILTYLQGWLLPLSLLAKGPQLLQNYQQGHTGHLAMLTCTAYFLGSLARAFTTYQEIQGDPWVWCAILTNVVLNTLLVGQMLYYWNSKPPMVSFVQKKERKKQEENEAEEEMEKVKKRRTLKSKNKKE